MKNLYWSLSTIARRHARRPTAVMEARQALRRLVTACGDDAELRLLVAKSIWEIPSNGAGHLPTNFWALTLVVQRLLPDPTFRRYVQVFQNLEMPPDYLDWVVQHYAANLNWSDIWPKLWDEACMEGKAWLLVNLKAVAWEDVLYLHQQWLAANEDEVEAECCDALRKAVNDYDWDEDIRPKLEELCLSVL